MKPFSEIKAELQAYLKANPNELPALDPFTPHNKGGETIVLTELNIDYSYDFEIEIDKHVGGVGPYGDTEPVEDLIIHSAHVNIYHIYDENIDTVYFTPDQIKEFEEIINQEIIDQ